MKNEVIHIHMFSGTFSPSNVPVSLTGNTNIYFGLKSRQLAAAISNIFISDFEKAQQYEPGVQFVGPEDNSMKVTSSIPDKRLRKQDLINLKSQSDTGNYSREDQTYCHGGKF